MAKAVKQHETADFFTRLTAFLEKFITEHLKTILIIIGVIAVGLGAYFTVDYLKERSESRAYSAFGKIYLDYKEIGGDEPGAESAHEGDVPVEGGAVARKIELIDDFKKIIDAYPKSNAASESAYIIGNILYEAVRYDEALEYFKKSRELSPKSLVAVISLKGEAACYEQKEDFEAAEGAYKRILEEYKNSFLVPLARFNLGQLYERQDKFKLAEQEYTMIVTNYEWSAWKKLAEKRLLVIKGQI
ncbi:MAG: tetratricopeptide repeat protein [Spirochaetes bacterium]|nr:tetratricopeptide repeat protein [Spirochaetota bacterium]